ncbi:MAG: UV DNA damage repair endonuclease UvsE [Caldilineaceae bacterium]|nr:UV DNA damage repair endonuclease UvsE [Caldilineaceae bacterium]
MTKPNLGLVCITDSDEVRYRAITRKRLWALSDKEQIEALRALYVQNIERFNKALDFCHEHEIRLYRYTSKLFPFADTDLGNCILDEFSPEIARMGRRAATLDIRLVVHPEQYVVLNSDSPDVVLNSINILAMHGMIMDRLEQPQTSWAAINIHGGKGNKPAELIAAIGNLPTNVRNRLTLENDEHIYSATEILDICRATGTPMLFDVHHHLCHAKLESYDAPSVADIFWQAQKTWPDREWQIVHVSNGREGLQDRRHHDLIMQMPEVFCHAPWIEVEAKGKEVAIDKLRREWPPLQKV